MDKARINQILQANKGKTFVDRIINRERYPVLDFTSGKTVMQAPEQGEYGTHKMAYVSVGDKYHVFPTILWDGKQLKQYEWREAYDKVKQTGNFISFDTAEEADDFSENYKLIWEK